MKSEYIEQLELFLDTMMIRGFISRESHAEARDHFFRSSSISSVEEGEDLVHAESKVRDVDCHKEDRVESDLSAPDECLSVPV